MRYLHSKHRARKGDIVEVSFDRPAKVMVLTDREFNNYKENKTFTYRGGNLENSPLTVRLDRDGTWHCVVELGSYYSPMQINASAKIVRDKNITPTRPAPESSTVQEMLDDISEDSSGDIGEEDVAEEYEQENYDDGEDDDSIK